MVNAIPNCRRLYYEDLEFQERSYLWFSSRGTPYFRWVKYGVPRIPRKALECVFYLYRTRDAAERGEGFGGTGFLVGHVSRDPTLTFVYGVTNWHVAVRDGHSVIRLNRADGTVDIFEFDPSEWTFIPNGDDVAMSPAIPLEVKAHTLFSVVFAGMFSTIKKRRHSIGVGEDVVMLGRFVDHDGGERNQPAARFGNISVMPTPIMQPNNVTRPTYLVDMHSRTGYSGSPVFVYRTPGNNLDHPHSPIMRKPEDALEDFFRDAFFELLGIHCGQFPEEWKITEKKAESSESKSLVVEGAVVTGLSGMTCVIPSDAILDLLELPEVKMKRSDVNAALKPPKTIIAETAKPDDDVATKRDEMLRAMLATPPQPRTKPDQKKVKSK